jgi:hypothetical protein
LVRFLQPQCQINRSVDLAQSGTPPFGPTESQPDFMASWIVLSVTLRETQADLKMPLWFPWEMRNPEGTGSRIKFSVMLCAARVRGLLQIHTEKHFDK